MAVRPQRGDGIDLKIIIIGNILGGKLGQLFFVVVFFLGGGKLSCLGGKLPLRPAP